MTDQLLTDAHAALRAAPPVGDPAYQRYCAELAEQLTGAWHLVRKANAEDVAAAEARGLPAALVDRLRLTDTHLAALVRLTRTVADELPAATAPGPEIPVGDWGTLRRVPKALGVVLMVYEARPTVTVEGALLPVVAGNAVLLRGGREMAGTDAALGGVVRAALVAAGLPADLVTVLRDPDRSVLRALLARPDAIDVLIPRGSPALIDHCRSVSSIPVIASGGGVNHLYVHRSADPDRAAATALDSKLAEPTACNTLELVLVDRDAADALVAAFARSGVAVTVKLGGDLEPPVDTGVPADGPVRFTRLGPHDLGREFLAPAIGVLPVAGPAEAAGHIRRYGSAHTEGIVAEDPVVVDEFVRRVDAAAIVVNGSLRLHDGPTLGLGSEISISTGRLHVRGPVTVGALLTHSWVVQANGALRAEREN